MVEPSFVSSTALFVLVFCLLLSSFPGFVTLMCALLLCPVSTTFTLVLWEWSILLAFEKVNLKFCNHHSIFFFASYMSIS